jgi:hypothetical protein
MAQTPGEKHRDALRITVRTAESLVVYHTVFLSIWITVIVTAILPLYRFIPLSSGAHFLLQIPLLLGSLLCPHRTRAITCAHIGCAALSARVAASYLLSWWTCVMYAHCDTVVIDMVAIGVTCVAAEQHWAVLKTYSLLTRARTEWSQLLANE